MARKKKKTNKGDVYLIIIGLLLLSFTICMIVLEIKGYILNDTLIISVFGVLGTECGCLSWIKTSKEKAEARKQELQDRKYFEKLNKENEDKGDEQNGIN